MENNYTSVSASQSGLLKIATVIQSITLISGVLMGIAMQIIYIGAFILLAVSLATTIIAALHLRGAISESHPKIRKMIWPVALLLMLGSLCYPLASIFVVLVLQLLVVCVAIRILMKSDDMKIRIGAWTCLLLGIFIYICIFLYIGLVLAGQLF